MKPVSAWCLGFFACLIFFWGGMTSSGFDLTRYWRLAWSSSEIEAVVTRTEPANHCMGYYEFEVNGERYQGKGSGGCTANIGDKLHVYYLPGHPSVSTIKEPGFELVFVIFAPMALSVVAGFVVMVRLGRP